MNSSYRIAIALAMGAATLTSTPVAFAQPFNVIKQQKEKRDFCNSLQKAHNNLLMNAQTATANGKRAEASKAKSDAKNVKVLARGNDCGWAV
jgi:hypothetical protein